MEPEKTSFFRRKLLDWYDPQDRPLPWKGIRDPYRIWLSEIILQQTRVEQGRPYYEKFVRHYPTLEDLATAPDDAVMKLWEGLGYYSRARNMLAAARTVVGEHNGRFPDTYESIRSLKGVGPYTAAAIASFAYNLPHAVLDGNVYRILARFFGIETPSDSTAGKKQFAALAQACLDTGQPGRYNQAIMDFGATVCKPRNPACTACPLRSHCRALAEDKIEALPVKGKKRPKKPRFFVYLDLDWEQHSLLHKRSGKDIWGALYQFPLIETTGALENPADLQGQELWQALVAPFPHELQGVSRPFQQALTHQLITAYFVKIKLHEVAENPPKSYFWQPKSRIREFAFPRIFDWYLGDNSLYLNL